MENSGSVIAEIFRVRINFNAQIMLIKLRLHTSARTRMYASDAYALTQSLKHIVIITELLSSPICLVNMYNPMWVRIIAARQVSSQKLHRKLIRNVVSWCSYFFYAFLGVANEASYENRDESKIMLDNVCFRYQRKPI